MYVGFQDCTLPKESLRITRGSYWFLPMYTTVETVLDSCGSFEFESPTTGSLILVVIGVCLGQFQKVQSISRFPICFPCFHPCFSTGLLD